MLLQSFSAALFLPAYVLDKTLLKDEYSSEEVLNRGNNIYRIAKYTGRKQLMERHKENTEIFKCLGADLQS